MKNDQHSRCMHNNICSPVHYLLFFFFSYLLRFCIMFALLDRKNNNNIKKQK